MNFYYDITLDFLENNYQFYEVFPQDQFWKIKKIPLFQVNNKTIKDFLNNRLQVDKEFLKLIYQKTMMEDQKCDYACILADKNNAIAVVFDENGINTEMSLLSLSDELNLLEIIYSIPLMVIDYVTIEKRPKPTLLRQALQIKNIILEEINKLLDNKNYMKLQYLYLEWFGKTEKDWHKMANQMKEQLDKDIGLKEETISEIIKMSYHNV